MPKTNCGYCHQCGAKLQTVLDGEEWCPSCKEYKRYRSHGWGSNRWIDPVGVCPERKEAEHADS